MVSFIIIGRNEGWKLSLCIQSVIKTIEKNQLKDFEIIYVDSNSTDNSIETAKSFKIVKILKLTGEINAGIARNVGADHSSGDILFFVDGDMELDETFFPLVYKNNVLLRDFVSGNWMNYYYDQNNNFLYNEKYIDLERDAIQTTTGGLFAINRMAWEYVGGMKNKFKLGEDLDLGLRLAKNNIYLLRKKELAANHHTVSYLDNKRMWKDLFNGNHLYHKSYLYRSHIFNKHIYKKIIREDYSLILLFLSSCLLMINQNLGILFLLLYFLLIFLRGKFIPYRFLYFFLRDVSVFFGFFLFFPKENHFKVKIVDYSV